MGDQTERKTRSDAVRNRERLLRAARDVFAEQGHDAPLEEVAQAASVSRATLYRHFPTREDLAMVVYEENVSNIEIRSGELRDADLGVVELFDFVLDSQRSSRSLAQVLSGADLRWLTNLSARTGEAFRPLLEQGIRSGIAYPDVTPDDILVAIAMAGFAWTDNERAGRGPMNEQVKRMLHRALFIES